MPVPGWARLARTLGPLAVGLLPALAAGEARAERQGAPQVALAPSLREACGEPSAGLDRVAEALVQRKARGEAPLDLPELSLALRAARVAYVWPRSWAARGPSDGAALARSFASFRAGVPVGGRAVCGAAELTLPSGERVAAVVVVDARGELGALKERSRVGEWLTIEAALEGDFRDAYVMVRGPVGAPRRLPGGFVQSTGKVRATFAPDTPGAFTVQVVGSTDAGPRPVLEARVFADVTPSYAPEPREEVAAGLPPADALFELVGRLRVSEGLRPLTRDARLDALALAHARAMVASRRLAHDTGAGDPRARAEAAGLRPAVVGENAATGREIAGLHRALAESPSHHANLRNPAFERVGVAVVADAAGALWGCELFAGGLR